jgi:hypothetical protein
MTYLFLYASNNLQTKYAVSSLEAHVVFQMELKAEHEE